MKSLKEALVDYDIAQLQALALNRGLDPPKSKGKDTISDLVDELLAPASIAIVADDLSDDERAALETLIAAGGFMQSNQFARRYGSIRTMGSSRLLREKPWLNPACVAESLWYRGVIFKGFHYTTNGPEEVVFIPDDLQAALPISATKQPVFQVSLSAIPAHAISSEGMAAREDLFILLAYLQTTIVHLAEGDLLPEDHQQAIKAQFSLFEAEDATATTEAVDHWFDFMMHLAHRMDFLRKQGRRLKLNSQSVRVWLQKTATEQIAQIQNAWRNDPTWNDLWHIPGLYPRQTGWENSPMLGRSKILFYLSQLPPDEWVSFNAFVQAVKRAEPDFQRPSGNYQSWYIYDAAGEPLMGFEHWDAVEGGLIKHLIGTVLFSMGVVDLGAVAAGISPVTFKITQAGRAFFRPAEADAPQPDSKPAMLRIDPADFSVRVPAAAGLYDRFQLARLAHLVKREKNRVVYQISRRSYKQALEQSITLEQVLAFLNRATQSQTPLALVESLRNWDRQTGAVKLEQLTVLRVNHESTLAELRNHPQIGPMLGQSIGPKAVVIPEKHLAAAKKYLQETGYFE